MTRTVNCKVDLIVFSNRINRGGGPGLGLKQPRARAELSLVLRAVRPASERSPIVAPANLESVDALLDLRAQIDEMLVIPGESLEIDCTALESMPRPVFGWLVQLQRELAKRGEILQCNAVSPCLALALRAIDAEHATGLMQGYLPDASIG